MLEIIKQKALQIVDPHRVYVGEKVYRTSVFWTIVLYSILSPHAFSAYGWPGVAALVIGGHLLDFVFWYVEENVFNFNPMNGSVGRRSN